LFRNLNSLTVVNWSAIALPSLPLIFIRLSLGYNFPIFELRNGEQINLPS
jgi:hypothetical protein